MHGTLHHLHQRQRNSRGEPYPHPNPAVRTLDVLIYIVSIVGPVTAIPQLSTIWRTGEVVNISFLYWAFALCATVLWEIYSLVHKVKPLIITNILGFVITLGIVIGIIHFRA